MIVLGVSLGIFIAILVIIFIVYNNRFQFCIIKIDKAEEDIGMYLNMKKNLLDRTIPIINKELKDKDFLSDLANVEEKDYNHFDMHNYLKKCYNELFKTIDDNEKLLKSDALLRILDDLNDNEEEIIGAIKFYNDTVVEFNKLIVTFPSKIVAFICHYKNKEFYNNEKREIFEILNESQE